MSRVDELGRKRLTVANVALLLFAVGAAACGQVLLKHGMETAKQRAESGHGSLVIAAATSPTASRPRPVTTSTW